MNEVDPDQAPHIRELVCAQLRSIRDRRAELAVIERALVHNARRHGITWDEIATEIPMSAGWMAAGKYGEPDDTQHGRLRAGTPLPREPRLTYANP
jgi:hypothetical protein